MSCDQSQSMRDLPLSHSALHEGSGMFPMSADLESLLDAMGSDLESDEERRVALLATVALFIAKWADCQWPVRSENETANDSEAVDRDIVEELPADLRKKLRVPEALDLPARQVRLTLQRLERRRFLPSTLVCLLSISTWFAGVFRMSEILDGLREWLRPIDLSVPQGREFAAGAFEEAIGALASHGGSLFGEFITPAPVVELMLDLANPRPGERIYDPCFGFGQLLAGGVRRVRIEECNSALLPDEQQEKILGGEIESLSYTVGLCRLLLVGVHPSRLTLGNTLEKPQPRDRCLEGYDCILAVPPWGGGASSSHGAIDSNRSENLFLQHVMGNLRPGGRAVIALPEGILYRSGSDQRVRKELLSNFRVDGVVSLPPGAFEPLTRIRTSLVALSAAEPNAAVRFASVSSTAWEAALSMPSRSGVAGDPNPEKEYEQGREAVRAVLFDTDDHPYRRISCDDLTRDIRDLIQHRRELNDGASLGVDSWDVQVGELALRGYELVAKKSGTEALERELSRISAADPSLKLEALGRVAMVHAGLTYRAGETTNRRDPAGVVAALIGAGDITDSGIRPPSLFLARAADSLVEDTTPVRAGDILVTTAGTVGKVGLVAELGGTVDILAGRSVGLIRVRPEINRHFLVALLRSPAYRMWLSGHARGTTSRRLSLRMLRTMKVPVPSLGVQESVVDEIRVRKPHSDALGVLYRLISGARKDSIITLLEGDAAASLGVGMKPEDTGGVDTLINAANEIQSLAIQPVASGSTTPADKRPISRWLEAARKAAIALDGFGSVPPGSGRLAILEFAVARFRESIGALEGSEGDTIGRLRSLTIKMVEVAERAVHKMQQLIHLEIGTDPTSVTVGVPSEILLQVKNASDVGLRDVRVSAGLPDGVEAIRELGYLREQEIRRVPVQIRPQAVGQVRMGVSWQARRVDGTAAKGEEEAFLLVSVGTTVVDGGDLGDSPYIVGSPVDRDKMFFGRAEEMRRIRRLLGGGDQANVILLEGNRRTGKTSILRQLGKTGALPGWIPVYSSFQDVDSVSTADVFRLLALRTGWTLAEAGIETWIPDQPRPESSKPFKLAFRAALHRAFSAGHPFETLEVYLAAAVEAAKPRGILLMLDEFDKLQEGIDGGITSPQVPENIRHLLQHQHGLGAIITGSRRLKRLREEYWSALFGFGYRIGVGALPKSAARRLVTAPVSGRLRYLPQARDRLVELCACHPFLIQSLCSRVFDHAAIGRDRTITLDIVERAATEMVQDNEHMQTLWGYVGSERGRLILALCDRLAAGSDAVNIYLLRMEFDECGVPVRRDEDLADEVAKLRELELIGLDTSYRSGTYILSIPLMAKWMERNVDFDDLVVRARQEAEDAL